MQDIKKLLDDLNKVKKGYKKESTDTLKEIGNEYQENVIANTPVDTGKLKKSIQVNQIGNTIVEVYSDVDYAPFVENGHLTKNGKFVNGAGMFQKAEDNIEKEIDKQVNDLFERLDKLWGE